MTPDALEADLQQPWRHGEHLEARGAVIESSVNLDGKALRGFDLTGAHIKGDVSARGATFLGLAWLIDARINGVLDLTGARFKIDLRADGLTAEALLLDEVQVRGVLDLARVRTERIALSRALIIANLTLEGATVRTETDLSESEFMGGFWAESARLGQLDTLGSDLHGRRRNWGGSVQA